MAKACRSSGSASPSRFVSCSKKARLLRLRATLGVPSQRLPQRWPAPVASASASRRWFVPSELGQIVQAYGDHWVSVPKGCSLMATPVALAARPRQPVQSLE